MRPKDNSEDSRPKSILSRAEYGSDVIVELLKAVGIEHVALNPGSSFRGLHDSLVNFGGNSNPDVILCCHEEIAVSIAHGYAKATGRPMAAVVHNIVGLQHASMAIYNAWCDRIPVMVLGATGPMDSSKRRPWVDWVHTAQIQGNLVRDFVKWDDQPFAITNVPESFLRAHKLMMTEPRAPVYLCYDIGLQEDRLTQPISLPDPLQYRPPAPPQADVSSLARAAEWLVQAENPVIIADYVGRNPRAVNALIELAELLAIPVIDTGNCFNFPSTHDLNVSGAEREVLREADLVLALDPKDLLYALVFSDLQARRYGDVIPPSAKVIYISLAELLVRSWACDYQRPQARDLDICADTASALPQLVSICRRLRAETDDRSDRLQNRRRRVADLHSKLRAAWHDEASRCRDQIPISVPRLCSEVWEVVRNEDWVLAHSNVFGWCRKLWQITEPRQYVGGKSGIAGGGLGYGIGGSIGIALANSDKERVCVDLQADGDLLYTSSALWTASHHRIPLLVIMFNNRSYYNSEAHAAAVAKERGRPEQNKGVGIRIDDPPVDFAQLAKSFGVYAEGPIEKPEELHAALEEAVQVVRAGLPALVDVVTQPR